MKGLGLAEPAGIPFGLLVVLDVVEISVPRPDGREPGHAGLGGLEVGGWRHDSALEKIGMSGSGDCGHRDSFPRVLSRLWREGANNFTP